MSFWELILSIMRSLIHLAAQDSQALSELSLLVVTVSPMSPVGPGKLLSSADVGLNIRVR